MYYILLSVLLFLLLIIIFNTKKDVFHPMFIAISCFLVGVILCFFNRYNWKYEIGFKTVLLFFLFFIVMILFSYLSDFAYKIINNIYKQKNNTISNSKVISNNVKIVCKYLMPIVLFLMFTYILNNRYILCLNYGYHEGMLNLNSLSLKWKELSLNGVRLNHLSTYFRYLLKGTMLISLYNIIVENKKNKIYDYLYYFILLIPYFLETFSNAWRGDFLYFASACIIFYGFRINDIKNDKVDFFKIIKFPFIILISIVLFWTITIFIREKKYDFDYILNYLSVYFGGGIPLFDEMLNGIAGEERSKYFGAFVFRNIYTILNRLDITNVEIRGIIPPSDSYVKTNIYTAFYRSYLDFGTVGTCIYWGIISFIYTLLYNFTKSNKNCLILRAFYGYYFTPLLILASEDYILQHLIGTTPIYIFISITIAYLLYHFFLANNCF